MKVKYSPIKWNEHASLKSWPDTEIKYINENTISIDAEVYEFDSESVVWPDIFNATGGAIMSASRDAGGELCIEVKRFYTGDCTSWDTGDYHALGR